MIKIEINAICDLCGHSLGRTTDKATQEGFVNALWRLKAHWKHMGVMEHRQSYRPTLHFCQNCADGHKIESPPEAKCNDCGKPYVDFPMDMVLPDEQWAKLCPEGGVLCASCIVDRSAKTDHSIVVLAQIQFAGAVK